MRVVVFAGLGNELARSVFRLYFCDGAVGGDQHAAALEAAGDQLEDYGRRTRLRL